ncbi:hypothetical protein [Methanothermobacter defluvii]|uniref:hypothetical protein n=1 Tax=Methanothermobacter defluvii TaxID=49339 RepID=UPI000E222EE0|nr:hypothetical protein [Methanothermobacter defluvii]
MKVAFIYDCAYPWVKGGAEKRIYEIVEVPITYRKRSDEPKLSSLTDGFKIFRTLVIERLR